jgi:hypothetical protein
VWDGSFVMESTVVSLMQHIVLQGRAAARPHSVLEVLFLTRCAHPSLASRSFRTRLHRLFVCLENPKILKQKHHHQYATGVVLMAGSVTVGMNPNDLAVRTMY